MKHGKHARPARLRTRFGAFGLVLSAAVALARYVKRRHGR